jgi:hypothetical protein
MTNYSNEREKESYSAEYLDKEILHQEFIKALRDLQTSGLCSQKEYLAFVLQLYNYKPAQIAKALGLTSANVQWKFKKVAGHLQMRKNKHMFCGFSTNEVHAAQEHRDWLRWYEKREKFRLKYKTYYEKIGFRHAKLGERSIDDSWKEHQQMCYEKDTSKPKDESFDKWVRRKTAEYSALKAKKLSEQKAKEIRLLDMISRRFGINEQELLEVLNEFHKRNTKK